VTQHWRYGAELAGGLRHSVQVQTDNASADFNLLIFDAAGQVIAADRGPEPGARCDLELAATQAVVFVVELVSGSGAFSVQVASQPLDKPSAPQRPRRERAVPSANTGGDGTGSDLTPIEAEQLLDAHNRWRDRYGVAALSWSADLAAHAQQWADELEATGMQMRHRSPNDFGENLYWCSGKAASADDVVDAWGNEDQLYDYAANNWWPDAGHFSQLVWHSTTEVGGAVVRSGGQELWVCNYDPRGNWTGQRPFEK